MTKRPDKNTIVVTGANGIIGFRVCEKALESGWRVSAFDTQTNQLEALAKKYPDDVLVHSCDLRLKADIQAGLEKTLKKWDSIEGLHNNAAWKGHDLKAFFAPFEDYDLSEWGDILAVNLDGVMLVDQVIGAHLGNRPGHGAIVHTASVYGVVAPDPRIYEGSEYMGGPINTPAVYAASKGAVISLSRYLAAYWGVKGVRVNSITPGGVDSGQNTIFRDKYSAKVPLGRMAQATEIADGVLFLLSPQASYITGHNLIIDGGFSIW